MSRILVIVTCLSLLLAALPVDAEEGLVCVEPLSGRLHDEARLAAFGEADDETVLLESGEVDAQLYPHPIASMSGGVLVRRGDRLARADRAEYDDETRSLNLDGNVRYEDPETEIVSQAAEFSYDTGLIRFDGAGFLMGANDSRGTASVLQISETGMLDLENVNYTTCPPDSNDWLIEASKINLNTNSGVGTARNVKLRFQGVPILYTPYISFPIGSARKSGVLTPTAGTAGRSGTEISMPYYWNIRENYDATISPRWLSDRGVQIGTEFRYLSEINEGKVTFEYLANDSLTGKSRHLSALHHQTLFHNGWRNLIEFREVSDPQYFEDLGGTLSLSSITHLNQSAQFDFFGKHWALFAQIQDYQTLDESIVPTDGPYRRLPQIRVTGLYPEQFLGFSFGFSGELVNFERDIGVTGWRLDAAPSLELPIEKAGWFVKPAVILEHTRYELDNTLPGQKTDPSRTLPIVSLDTGMILERTFKRSHRLIQTIEPRLLYVHVPFRDQTDLPVFDTIVPDLNFVQLYRKNRFLGVDRIGDTDQVSFGVTSRILDVNTGEELVSATIGRARSLKTPKVVLPGQATTDSRSSDYIAELGVRLFKNINFDVGHQWGSDGRGTIQSEARLQYQPQSNKILNLAYRFRRDSLEQGDVSVSWPLSKKWNFVGRYNYSFRDREMLERFFGFEYESCCWGLRVVSRRFVSSRDGTSDSSFGIQLVLKGMGSVGTAADKLLERGILGYSPDFD